ncbi:glucohydrolase [Sporanaerobium hydrogeniformans]|uniref:Glucohydrolase n=1 Tax=Sporanaerobium hydrogeniformans TaxID=3072179 RepID=A0AC61DB30_9FIRM|nr:alpha-glucosidase [Sporanaerobium hydrogeniformans]PHV70489.1 glucohydrolase [Sporanaerobium hydrogeniformans]
MKDKWWKKVVAYQIYPRSFMDSNGDGIGDLQGVISKLDYLKDLGIDVIWLSPIYASPNADNGYDISDYLSIMQEFGTMEDFDHLLEEVHQRGMKLIMDLVINHTSDEHPWFIESRASKSSSKRDWYIWRKPKEGKEPNNWASIFGGSAWEYDEASGEYYLHLFDKKQPDLNWENQEVRRALYDMINTWLEKGIDGFRIDAISHIKKAEGFPDLPNPKGLEYVPSFQCHMNQPGILTFLNELSQETFAKYDIMTVGEANGVVAQEGEEWAGENGVFDMIFQFEHLALWDNTDNPSRVDMLHVKKALSKWQEALCKKGWNALFIENHDLPRVVSRLGNDKKYWKESSKALAMMYFMMQGTPFIYQGQEIGMTNIHLSHVEEYKDVQTISMYKEALAMGKTQREALERVWNETRENSRTPMQWNRSSNAGFTTGIPWFSINPNYREINVEAQREDPYSIFHFYKKLIKIKKTYPVFEEGNYKLLLKEDQYLFVYTRTTETEKAMIICNFSEDIRTFQVNDGLLASNQMLLSNYPVEYHEALQSIELRPYEARLYKCI